MTRCEVCGCFCVAGECPHPKKVPQDKLKICRHCKRLRPLRYFSMVRHIRSRDLYPNEPNCGCLEKP